MLPFPLIGISELLFRLMHNHKCLNRHRHIESNLHVHFMVKDRHLMPGVIHCLCVTLWCSDVTDWSSYSYWTRSFFGHSGFAPVGTGNPLAERGKRPLKGKKTRTKKKKTSGDQKETIFSLSQWLQQSVTLNILSWCWFVLFTEGQEKHWVYITAQFWKCYSIMNMFSGEQKKNASVL